MESRGNDVQEQSSEVQSAAQDAGDAGGQKDDDSTQGQVDSFLFAHACQYRGLSYDFCAFLCVRLSVSTSGRGCADRAASWRLGHIWVI